MRYLRVKNYERYQHYKSKGDSSPAWLKLYRSVLTDYEFTALDDAARSHLILIWLLASQLKGRIPDDPKWVKAQIHASGAVNLKQLVELGLLIPDSESALECFSESGLEPSDECPSPLISSSLISSSEETKNLDPEWPASDQWLKTFLETKQKVFNGAHLPELLNHDWWDTVSDAVNGIDEPFLAAEFAKMRGWFIEHPRKVPTPKGIKTFVRSWLQREAEYARKRA